MAFISGRRHPPKIVVVGPPLDQIGGMTTVVQQMLGMDLDDRFDLEFVPFTLSKERGERWYSRGVRHLRQTRRLQGTIRRTGARIAHLHTCSAVTFYRSLVDMLAVRRLGARTILHVHGARFDAFHEQEPAYRRRLIRWALSRADCVVALSSAWADKLARIAPKARLRVIENAVEVPPPPGPREAADACGFLLLARMDEWKGIDDLLDACAVLRRTGVAFQLTLAGPPGTAGDAEQLDAKIHRRDLGTVVRYVGPVRGVQKTALLTEADAYVQPSHHEGMPIAVLEALGYGLPSVATAVGAIAEVVGHQRQGLVVPPRRPELLAQAMRQLAVDPALRRTMSVAARSLAEARFSVDRFREDLLSLYESIHATPAGHRLRSMRSACAEHGVPGRGHHLGASAAAR